MNSKWTNKRPTSLCPRYPCAPQQYLLTQHVWLPRHVGQNVVRLRCNMVQPHHKYAARGHKRQLTVGDEAKDAKALAQKILQNSTDMYRHVQTCTDNKMIVWISSATQKLLWRAWDEPPEPMTLTSWESTTRQLHQKPEVFMAWLSTGKSWHLCHDICAMTPWDPYW